MSIRIARCLLMLTAIVPCNPVAPAGAQKLEQVMVVPNRLPVDEAAGWYAALDKDKAQLKNLYASHLPK